MLYVLQITERLKTEQAWATLKYSHVCRISMERLYRNPRINEFVGKRPKCSWYQALFNVYLALKLKHAVLSHSAYRLIV